MSDSKRILIVEDHELLSQGVSLALKASGYEVTTSIETSLEGIRRLATETAPDLVLLDLQLGDIGAGHDVIGPLSALGAAVLILTGVTDEAELGACIEAGAVGVVAKSSPFDTLLDSIAHVLSGRPDFQASDRARWLNALRNGRSTRRDELAPFSALTAREATTLALLVQGRAAEAIAAETFVSLATVRSHIRAILQKLGVNSQLAAVALARRNGWSPPADADSPRP
jgi:DNA-binding NarL/FixJ family response regulator